MLRKMIKMLLCLMLAVMLPLCAIADTQHTFRIIPGSGMGVNASVADLLDVLSLTVTKGDRSGALTLELEDTAIATVALSADATGVYVHSNLLSDDVLYVTWDDGFAYLTEVMKAAMQAEGMPESELAALEQGMAEIKNVIVKAEGSGMVGGLGTLQSNAAALVLPDNPDGQTFAAVIGEKMVVENGSFADAQRDTADQKYMLTLTSEDMLKLCDTEYMRTLMREVAAAANSGAQAEELEKAADEMLEQAREAYRTSDYEMVMTMYTQNGGTVMVGMELGVSMPVKEENASTSLSMNLNYDRLTNENGVNHMADMAVSADGSSAVEMAFELHRGVNAVSEGRLAMLADGEEITFLYRAENTEPDVRQRRVDLYLRSGATAIIPPAFSDRPLISFEVVTSPADPSVLGRIGQADAHNSVNVMKLSDEEMQTLVSGVQSRVIQAAYSALAKLPTSALQLAMQLIQ